MRQEHLMLEAISYLVVFLGAAMFVRAVSLAFDE
jgi:hypothetical protein